MSQSQEYGFCPNCGAVSKNGVCTSCGFKKRSASSFTGKSASGEKGYLAYAVASIVLIVLFVTGLTVYHFLKFDDDSLTQTVKKPDSIDAARGSYSSVSVSSTEASVPEINTWDDDFFSTFAGRVYTDFESFDVPENTMYAEESGYDYLDRQDFYIYDDYIRTDLDYKIINKTWKYNGYYADEYGEGYPNRAFIRCDYPIIDSDTCEFADSINDNIIDMTTYICDYYDLIEEYLEEDEVCYCEEYVYVTYMSEDALSLLFQYDAYYYNEDDEEDEPELALSTVKTLNFNMKTGGIWEMPEIALDEESFLELLANDISEQNEVTLLDMVSMDELKEAYEDGAIEWFYNPLGVEFMYVFPDLYGYFSCTEDPGEVFRY